MKRTKPRPTRAYRKHSEHAALRAVLVNRRKELLEQVRDELGSVRGDAKAKRCDDICDRADEALYGELASGLAEIASVDLLMIDRAVQKIDTGAYGLCEVCGRHIPRARLELVPFAELCVECKRQEEEAAAALPVARPHPMEEN